jgi:hypothetical protein
VITNGIYDARGCSQDVRIWAEIVIVLTYYSEVEVMKTIYFIKKYFLGCTTV